jgi:hypothetical protein
VDHGFNVMYKLKRSNCKLCGLKFSYILQLRLQHKKAVTFNPGTAFLYVILILYTSVPRPDLV